MRALAGLRLAGHCALFVALPALLAPTLAQAQLKQRQQISLTGDFVIIGSTMGYDCRPSTPAPLVGTVDINACGLKTDDSALDVFWRSQSPDPMSAVADPTIAVTDSRTTVTLGLAPGAAIEYARLYWASRLDAADTMVTLDRPGGATFVVAADDTMQITSEKPAWTQSTADVTQLVRTLGPGPIRFSSFAFEDVRDKDLSTAFAAWALVVFYAAPNEAPRQLTVFDGMALVEAGQPSVQGQITGFLVPSAGYDAHLGVVAYEGDSGGYGDSLRFNGKALADPMNPDNNFFNGSRSWLGKAVSDATLLPPWRQNTGDLPRLSGAPQSELGVDLDVVDITSGVKPGDTSATFELTTSNTTGADKYAVGVFVTSIATLKPDFLTSTKTATNLAGRLVTYPGDEIEYTLVVRNTGNDNSLGTVLEDALPPGLNYKPGSIRIVNGTNAGPKTDAAGDDQAEYDAAGRRVIVRLGLGATANMGGLVCGGPPSSCPSGAGPTTTVAFRVIVDFDAIGTIENQGTIIARGEHGEPQRGYPTDGDSLVPGSSPTPITVVRPPDMAQPDLIIPDLLTVDLAMPDLIVRDLAAPDLKAIDLGQPPDLTVPDLTALADLAGADLEAIDLRATADAGRAELGEEVNGGGLACYCAVGRRGDAGGGGAATAMGALVIVALLALRRRGRRQRSDSIR